MRISQQNHQLNHLKHLLNRAIDIHHEHAKSDLIHIQKQLKSQQPDTLQLKNHFNQQQQLMKHLLSHQQQKSQHALRHRVSQLASLNPLAVLTRGYSYTSHQNGDVITDSKQVKKDEIIATQLKSGKILSKIVERFD